MSSAGLAIQNVTKSFGALRVTDDISLNVEPGELHAIIGPNGAGKTTLIHQLSGHLKVDAGKILLEGADITNLTMAERVRLGIVRSFQVTSILQGFSVLENTALAVQARSGSSFRFFGRARDEDVLNAEAMEALRDVSLDDRADARAGSLSHGEKRQLELAIALASKPSVLLLDEPLAGTGHDESINIARLIRTLKGQLTIILIEHDMDAVFALADRISVLVYGQLIKTGKPVDVRADPDVRAAYLGDEAA